MTLVSLEIAYSQQSSLNKLRFYQVNHFSRKRFINTSIQCWQKTNSFLILLSKLEMSACITDDSVMDTL